EPQRKRRRKRSEKMVKTGALVALVAFSVCVANAAELEDSQRQLIQQKTSLRDALMSQVNKKKKRKNSPICYEIVDSWWSNREAEKTRSTVTQMDDDCKVFSGDAEACNNKKSRGAYQGTASQSQLDAVCTMVGAHNKRCLGNPCNHLNTGDCSIQATGGQCVWYTSDDVNTINKYFKDNGIDNSIPGHGCYRNPCNQPGFGKLTDKECKSHANGLYECTWCKGAGDRKLKGKGVGCQIVDSSTTTGLCAPVNSNAVTKSTIYQAKQAHDCQCSNDYAICEEIITGNRGPLFEPRFP
ncbi:Uncharacterized protein SCF082_LOCUS47835, partial [Durusdinium trenchii]